MPSRVHTITGSFMKTPVNCYLLTTPDGGFILIDTCPSSDQALVLSGLERAGCAPGKLKLIALTHGDFDHTGNAALLRERFGAPVAIHRNDAVVVERGDMFVNKTMNPAMKVIARFALRFTGSFRAFQPDLFLEDQQALAAFGMDARVLHLPGHSKGSTGILTAEGDLFCGDLFENTQQPALNSLVDDAEAMQASLRTLKGLPVRTVYPGHGEPFLFERIQPGA